MDSLSEVSLLPAHAHGQPCDFRFDCVPSHVGRMALRIVPLHADRCRCMLLCGGPLV